MDNAATFVQTRKALSTDTLGLTSQQRSISLDLMATGIASTLWDDAEQALTRMKEYWDWFKQETEKNAGLGGLLKQFIAQEQRNANNGGIPLQIPSGQLRSQVDVWVSNGWLYEKPRGKEVKELMLDLGMRLQQGIWRKG